MNAPAALVLRKLQKRGRPMTPDDLNAMDLEKAITKIEEGIAMLRPFDELAAYDIWEIIKSVRGDAEDELDSARDVAA